MSELQNPNRRRPSVVIAPDQVIGVLLGADSVELNGFGGIPVRLPFWVPVVSHLNPSLTLPANRRSGSTTLWIAMTSAAIGAVALGFLGYWVKGTQEDVKPNVRVQAGWVVKAVEKDVVLIQIGNAQVRVPVGSPLPNGETLRSVDPARRSFATDNQITAVRQ